MFQRGDFIKIDYTLTVKETEELVDTTNAEQAKRLGKFEEGRKYEPELIVVGGGWVPKALEDALLEMDTGVQKLLELTAEKAFGPRDANKIRTVPLRKFKDLKSLNVGARVDVGGKVGTVKAIGAGRVVVDFNPPLSGRTLVYDVKVVENIVDDKSKVIELVRKRMPFAKSESFLIEITGKAVRIRIPEEALLAEGLQYVKRALFNDITSYLKDIEEVVFEEAFRTERPTEQKAQEQPSGQTGEQTQGQAETKPENRGDPNASQQAQQTNA